MGYYLIEPFGQSRNDDGARLVASVLYNANRGKDAKVVMPSEFMQAWRPAEEIDEADRVARVAAWFEARAI